MCGIFGVLDGDYSKFIKLYQRNQERGDFAFGALFTRNNDRTSGFHLTVKCKENFSIPKDYPLVENDKASKIEEFKALLGHTQAPTSSKREFSAKTSHPFQCNKWYVAHNGVLSNDRIIATKLTPDTYNEVDSSVIPALFHKTEQEHQTRLGADKRINEVDVICESLSQLQGTMGLWICNSTLSNVYLARSGSTLYANYLDNSFSSTKEPKMEELAEGTLYQLTPEGVTAVGKFNSNSPFFL